MKADFICIVAGYKEEVNKCFFAYNQGLESRFPIRFDIEGYNEKDLFLILKKKILDSRWILEDNINNKIINILKENKSYFKFYGRDIENFLTQIKRCHSRRVFTLDPDVKKKLTLVDINNGFKLFKSYQKEDKSKSYFNNMYI